MCKQSFPYYCMETIISNLPKHLGMIISTVIESGMNDLMFTVPHNPLSSSYIRVKGGPFYAVCISHFSILFPRRFFLMQEHVPRSGIESARDRQSGAFYDVNLKHWLCLMCLKFISS